MAQSQKQQAQALIRSNRMAEAYAIYKSICGLDKSDLEPWVMLGLICSQTGRIEEAIEYYRQAINIQPENTAVRYNLGAVLCTSGRVDEAETELRKTISVDANHELAWTLLGHVLVLKNMPEEADRVYSSAVGKFTGNAMLHANYAATLVKQGRVNEAARLCQRAVNLSPDIAWFHDLMGSILSQQGMQADAEKTYARAVSLEPGNRQYYSNWLLQQHYLASVGSSDLVSAHRGWPGNKGQVRRTAYDRDASPDRDLRIGYLSQDFRTHSVAYFAQNLLGRENRRGMEIYCYSDGPSDDMTGKLIPLADQWRSVLAMKEEAVAELIEEDRIDILVELNGHTSARILSIVALQPAPVQVTYLGYPDTTGLTAIDYRITDSIADPPGRESASTEKLVRIPGCFLCYTAPDESPGVEPLPCESRDFITFGSFNNQSKINASVMELWSQILLRIPGSRLYLKNKALADGDVRARMTWEFADLGIDSERLILGACEPGTREHLARYADIDIGLDTFPYCGTTTTCEALWMGVPVISLTGECHSARVGESLLQAVGHPEWIAGSPEEYIELAAGLAGDLKMLAELRSGLRELMSQSTLCDGGRFTEIFSQALREMWVDWCKSEPVNQ